MADESFWIRWRKQKPAEPAERRRCVRTATVFQVAKIVTPAFEELCVLRDVSPSGLKAEVYCPVAAGERVEIELKTEHRVAGTVMWSREGAIGIGFDVEVPVLAMLAHCAFDDRVARIRPPRLDTVLDGMLVIDGAEQPVIALNISQAGIKIALESAPASSQRATIVLRELGQRSCCIRWARGREAGLLLDEPLSYPEFVDWRRRVLGLILDDAA